jgi:hypothetical protein
MDSGPIQPSGDRLGSRENAMLLAGHRLTTTVSVTVHSIAHEAIDCSLGEGLL